MAKFKINEYVTADREHKKLCIIVPAANIEEARDIAIDYMINDVKTTSETRNGMLPTKLSFSGKEPATHYLCHGNFDAEEYDKMANKISGERLKGKSFCNSRKISKNEIAGNMTGSFCVIDATKEELLSKTGLKEIK